MSESEEYSGKVNHGIARDLFKRTIPSTEGGHFRGEFILPGKEVVWRDPGLVAKETQYNTFKRQLVETANEISEPYLEAHNEGDELVRYSLLYCQEENSQLSEVVARFEGILPAEQYEIVEQNFFYRLQ